MIVLCVIQMFDPKRIAELIVPKHCTMLFLLFVFGFLGLAQVRAAEFPPINPKFVQVHVVRTNTVLGSRWFVWAVHAPGEYWSLQGTTEVGNPDAWFNIVNYTEDGVVVSAVVPDTRLTMVFRARKRR